MQIDKKPWKRRINLWKLKARYNLHLQCPHYQDWQDTNHLPCQPLPGERHRLERPQCLELLSWMPFTIFLSLSFFIAFVFVIVSVYPHDLCQAVITLDHFIFILFASILLFSPVHTPWSLFSLARPPPLASSEPHNQSHHKMNHFVIIEGIHHDDEQDDAVIEHLLITSIACLGPNSDPGSHVVVVETCVKTSCSHSSSYSDYDHGCDYPYVDGVDNDISPNLIMMMLKMTLMPLIYRKGWKESCHQKRKEEYWSCTCRCRSVNFDSSHKSKYKYTHCDVMYRYKTPSSWLFWSEPVRS